jgi:hypothetical protein
MKKGFQFKDLCHNIELNVKEMAKSRFLSQKFLLNKIPDNFLLINHEKFCEKKEKLIEKALAGKKISKTSANPNVNAEGNFHEITISIDNDKNEVKHEADKIEAKPKRNILSYLSELTQKKEILEEIEKKEREEKIRKKVLEQQRMGYNVHHEEQYANVPQEQQYYEQDHHYPYQHYEHYISPDEQYNAYPPHSDIKDEYNHPPMHYQHQMAFPIDPHAHMAYMKNPEIMQQQPKPEPESKTDEEEYDPLQSF